MYSDSKIPKVFTPSIDSAGEGKADDITTYISNLTPAIDIRSNSEDSLILLDSENDNAIVRGVSASIFLALVGRSIAELIQDTAVMKVIAKFNPYQLKSLYLDANSLNGNFWHVNHYTAPKWRFVEVQAEYGGFIKTLIEHLFPNPEEREYVLDWIHYAIVKRNSTMLCLVGDRGTGKGILLNTVIAGLIGHDYREIVGQDILKEKFNGAFKGKRYIVFDEVDVETDQALSKIRAFANDQISVEKKGDDSETIENFTSMSLSSNNKKSFKVEPQERRFSVPEVTSESLFTIMTEPEVEEAVRALSDPLSPELAAFGNFLLNRVPRNSSNVPLKGAYFFEICRMSMPEWKLFIIDYFINEGTIGEEVKNSILTKKFKKSHGDKALFPAREGTIASFLGDYKHEGYHRIGDIVKVWDSQRGRDTFAIRPNKDFLLKYGKNYNGEGGGVSFEDALDEL